MALMTSLCFLSAFLLSKAKIGFIHDYKKDYVLVTIIFSILMLCIMIALANKCKQSCEKNESKLKQYGFAYAFIFLASLSVSGALIIYDAQSAIYSFAAACLVFLGSAIYAHNSKNPNLEKSLLHHGFKISLGVIALCLVNLFIGSSAVHTAISIICFALIVIIEILNSIAIDKKLNFIKDFKRIEIETPEINFKNGFYKTTLTFSNNRVEIYYSHNNKIISEKEFNLQLKTNGDLIKTRDFQIYPPSEEKTKEKIAENFLPYAALCLFSQIISYFLMIIEIFGNKEKGQGSSSIIDIIPNLSIDKFNITEALKNCHFKS